MPNKSAHRTGTGWVVYNRLTITLQRCRYCMHYLRQVHPPPESSLAYQSPVLQSVSPVMVFTHMYSKYADRESNHGVNFFEILFTTQPSFITDFQVIKGTSDRVCMPGNQTVVCNLVGCTFYNSAITDHWWPSGKKYIKKLYKTNQECIQKT